MRTNGALRAERNRSAHEAHPAVCYGFCMVT
jgi:hypothetical protein